MAVLLTPGPLLDEEGNLIQAGYAYQLVKVYDSEKIKQDKIRLKEWDYYYIGNSKIGVALTVADNQYMGMLSASLLDFTSPKEHTSSKISWFTRGKFALPSTSKEGDIIVSTGGVQMRFAHEGDTRHLYCKYPNFQGKLPLEVDIRLKEFNKDTMVIALPFDKPRRFYYNQKINNLIAEGYAKLGDKAYYFNKDCYGVLDWGRGMWTYENTWYWSSLSGQVDSHMFGWNLGYGFGDNSNGTENMIFYDGKAYKLDQVIFDIPRDEKGQDDFMSKWKIRSNDGILEADFVPVIDRKNNMNVLVLGSNQHQVFGRFSGKIILPNKKVIDFKDMFGFAEKVHNRW